MLIGINPVSENCSKSNSGHEPVPSGTTTPKSESTQPYSAQIKPSKQMAYPQYPPGKLKFMQIFKRYTLMVGLAFENVANS